MALTTSGCAPSSDLRRGNERGADHHRKKTRKHPTTRRVIASFHDLATFHDLALLRAPALADTGRLLLEHGDEGHLLEAGHPDDLLHLPGHNLAVGESSVILLTLSLHAYGNTC